MNPQFLDQLRQMIMQSMQGRMPQATFGFQHPGAIASPAPASPTPDATATQAPADYYGPADGKAQYFANMGLGPDGLPVPAAQPAPQPNPQLDGGGWSGMGQMSRPQFGFGRNREFRGGETTADFGGWQPRPQQPGNFGAPGMAIDPPQFNQPRPQGSMARGLFYAQPQSFAGYRR